VLIYDLNTHKAYNLNETSSIVYQACDGKTSFSELKSETNFTDELIFLAIINDVNANLVNTYKTIKQTPEKLTAILKNLQAGFRRRKYGFIDPAIRKAV
jgi:hypothetical protein